MTYTPRRYYGSALYEVRKRQHPAGTCLGVLAEPACGRVHGNESHYQAGCHCDLCRKAHTDYRRDQRDEYREAGMQAP